ncbi:MAG: hypothetical protein N3B21_13105 [Clostridia bacterium]|nr:hypothetical protein [Clostridia bacterium]
MSEQCQIYDRVCIDCDDCVRCDLEDSKRCDNCGRCIDETEEFRTLNIKEFIEVHEDKEKFKKEGE